MDSSLTLSPETDPTTPKLEREEGMGGLAKGLAIIECFGLHQPRLTVSEAAAATGTTPAAARRCLLTLESLGFVSHDGKFFHPTPRMVRLAGAYTETATLPVLAQPRLTALREKFDESTSLAVLDDEFAFFVARSESSHMVSTGMRVGARLPAPASSAGRVLLAALPDADIDRHLAVFRPQATARNTLTTISSIRDRILQARVDGYAMTDEELELGVRAVAAPVIDATGVTRAAMTISALAARVTAEEMHERFVPELIAEATRLGNML